jgi:hypothetical protein
MLPRVSARNSTASEILILVVVVIVRQPGWTVLFPFIIWSQQKRSVQRSTGHFNRHQGWELRLVVLSCTRSQSAVSTPSCWSCNKKGLHDGIRLWHVEIGASGRNYWSCSFSQLLSRTEGFMQRSYLVSARKWRVTWFDQVDTHFLPTLRREPDRCSPRSEKYL